MKLNGHRGILFVMILSIGLPGSGCSYMKARGNDAKNMFDLGISINKSWKPQFAFYFDCFNMTPIGYGAVRGVLSSVLRPLPREICPEKG